VSYKSALQNAYSIPADRLLDIQSENPVIIHPDDAKELGVSTGDRIELRTPGGLAVATALVHYGVMRGVVAIEHGFGHRELGARAHQIGLSMQPERGELSAGINLNDLGLADPTRKGKSIWVDAISGASVRNGLPARVAKV